MHTQVLFKRCIIFLIDGARPDVLNDELKKGNLPNLARYFAEEGTNQTILTSFPSTTGPAYLPFLTGCYPGTCNIPGIRWFDKSHYAKHGWSFKSFRSYVGLETFLLNHDICKDIKTAFEIFDHPLSIMSMVNRGSARGKNLTKFSRIWYFYYAHLTDRWAFVDQSAAQKLITGLERNPDFAFVVFPAVDEYSHRSSPFHPRTIQAYHDVDRHIGQIVEKLKRKGELDETLMVIVSDHGLSDTKAHFDVGPWLDSKGIKAFYYTQIFKRNFKAASMVSGNGMAHLYFKNEKGWTDRTTFEELSHTGILLDELRCQEAVSLVACQGADGSIHLLTSKGHGLFHTIDGNVNYQWDRNDPLGIFDDQDKNRLMTLDESVEKTWNSHYPDVFDQLRQLFSSRRTGDVVISANSGFDFRERYEHPEHKASHGAICPEHMWIPFLMNYRLDKRCYRSVDVFPTILKLLGKEIPEEIDGKSLV